MIFECPGSGKYKRPYPEALRCSCCGKEAEIWSDEATTVCPNCGQEIARKTGQSCLDWCKYAKECVGEEAYRRYEKNKEGGR